MKWCVLVLAFASVSRGDQNVPNLFSCPPLNAQEEIDLDKVCARSPPFASISRNAPLHVISSFSTD